MQLISLQLQTTANFEYNLSKLIQLIQKQTSQSFIVAPELVLSGYSYDNMDKAVALSTKAISALKPLSKDRVIALTLMTKKQGSYYNTLFVFFQGKIIHTQSKAKLFALGNETKYFHPGDHNDIKLFNIAGLKVGALICFEIRFVQYWERLKGADIIIVPALWGKIRKSHFEALCKALAIANQCFVIASDSANEHAAKSSAIISPFGDVLSDDRKRVLHKEFHPKQIRKMRKYLDIGLKP